MVFFTISVIFTMTASGDVEVQTKRISQTSDDGFVTETGTLFDTALATILDPNQDIRAFVVFRGIKINRWERLQNATLILSSAGTLEFDTSSVTVNGIRRVAQYLPIDAFDVFSVSLTGTSTTADTSFFYGSAKLEIDVTSILRELMMDVGWTGDGLDGSGSGEKVGFLILGAEGHATRYFYDKFVGNGLEAKIVIYWGVPPTPPPETGEPIPGDFNDTSVYTWTLEDSEVPFEEDGDYNETIDIWRVDAFGAPEFLYITYDAGDEAYYHNSTSGVDGAFQIGENWGRALDGGATSPILRMGKWTLIMGDPTSTTIFISDDEFTTNSSYSPNAPYNLASFDANVGSIAVDRQTENIVHLVYPSKTPGQPANWNIIYTNFTLDLDTGIPTFAPSYTNITQWSATQFSPVIHVQENGTLHVVWYGQNGTTTDQVWYRRRHDNNTWLDVVRVSETDVLFDPNAYPDVVANSETGVALVVWEYDRDAVLWDVIFPNNTKAVNRQSTGAARSVVPSMVMDRERNEALMVWSTAFGQPAVIYFQNKTITNSSAWSADKQVSPGGEKHFNPDIGIETENGTIQVIWYNDFNTQVAGNYWSIGSSPVPGKTKVSNVIGRFNYIEEEFIRSILNTTYFVVWGNGTVISGPLDSLDDVDDFLEELFGVDPLDPNPATQGWDEEGPFTRFSTRLYFLLIGFMMVFGPMIVWAMRRPTAYVFVIGAFIMLIGFALMYAAGQV